MLKANMFDLINEFFSSSKEVNNLEEGARLFGGSTQINDYIYSNIKDSNNIDIRKDNNIIRLFVPSTLNYSNPINNREYVKRYSKIIMNKYNIDDITLINAKGSYKEDDNSIIYEDVTLIEVALKDITKNDINFFLSLANRVKKEMTQYCISVSINNSLALV